MFWKLLPTLVLCLGSTTGFESIIRPSFPAFEEAMAAYGGDFDWVNHEVHTDDGYILNMFRLRPLRKPDS